MTNDEKILETDPFSGDYGTPGDRVLQNKMVVARKQYKCCHCCGTIEVGERHRHQVDVFDDELGNYRWCAECCEAMVLDWDEGDINRMEARVAIRKATEG